MNENRAKAKKSEIKRNTEDLMEYEILRNLLLKMIAKGTKESRNFEKILNVLDVSASCANAYFTDIDVEEELEKIYFILA